MKPTAHVFFLITGPAILLSLFSCTKKEQPIPAKDYFPTTAGSHWDYTGEFPQTISITGNTKTYDGKVYQERQTTENGQSFLGFLNKNNGAYAIRSFRASRDTSGTEIEFVFLKDNVPAGTSWTQTVTPSGSKTTFFYKKTISEKDVAYSINNVTYEKVIVVKNEISVLGDDTPFLTHYSFFAYGVGLIRDQKSEFGFSNLSAFEVK